MIDIITNIFILKFCKTHIFSSDSLKFPYDSYLCQNDLRIFLLSLITTPWIQIKKKGIMSHNENLIIFAQNREKILVPLFQPTS